MTRFADNVVLITGGGSGIGRATAMAFARQGARLIVGDCNAELGPQIEAEIQAAGSQALFVKADVRNAADVRSLVDRAIATFGRLDIAFNNAGVEGMLGPLVDQDESNYQAVMDVNVRGIFLCMKYQIACMLQQGHGAIINNASVAGSVGMPGAAIYSASKHAVLGLTRSAALECAKTGIRINAVSPGFVDTPMVDRFSGGSPQHKQFLASTHPTGRMATAEEVARVVLWLASEDASFVTGQSINIDGGYLAQ